MKKESAAERWRFLFNLGYAVDVRSNLLKLHRLLGMRWIILYFIFLFSLECNGQVERFWIEDTANIRKNYYDGDTSYYWKKYHGNIECYMYYDSIFKQKASYHRYGPYNNDADSAWFRNGKVKAWGGRSNNCMVCWTTRKWYANGQLKFQEDCPNDTCTSVHYYPSGKISGINKHWQDTGDFPNSPGWHYKVEYYENGQRQYDPINPRLKGEQPVIEYYESGSKKSKYAIYSYINILGPYSEWHENGQIKITGQYAAVGRKVSGISLTDRDGTWSYYNESGKLIKEEFYEEGKLVKTIEY
jgi:hypothetical protein